jgi:hypothetical protein
MRTPVTQAICSGWEVPINPLVGGRGSVSVCEVLVEQCIETGTVHSVTNHGVLSNGVPFETKNLLENTSPSIGRLVHKQRH